MWSCKHTLRMLSCKRTLSMLRCAQRVWRRAGGIYEREEPCRDESQEGGAML